VLVAVALRCVVMGADIHDAAKAGNLEKVKALIAADPTQIDTRDEKGHTPLLIAVNAGSEPRELAYFEAEEPNERYICHRERDFRKLPRCVCSRLVVRQGPNGRSRVQTQNPQNRLSGSISEGLGKFKACFHLYGACTRGLGCLLRPHQNRRSAV
jgi:hypothetical protein